MLLLNNVSPFILVQSGAPRPAKTRQNAQAEKEMENMEILGSVLRVEEGKLPLRLFNAQLRSLNYTQENRAEQLGRATRTIERWDREDKKRECLKHVFSREIVREDVPGKAMGAGRTEKINEILRCRFCGHERPGKTRFFHDLPTS